MVYLFFSLLMRLLFSKKLIFYAFYVIFIVLFEKVNLSKKTDKSNPWTTSLVEHGRKNVLKQIAEYYVRWFLTSKTQQECCNSTHSLTVANFIKTSCNCIKNISDIKPCGMLILHALLNDIEKLFHGIVKDTKICSPSNNILIDNFSLIREFISASMKQSQEMIILVVFLLHLFAILNSGYRFYSHERLRMLSFYHPMSNYPLPYMYFS